MLRKDEEIVCLYGNIKDKRDAAKTGKVNSYEAYPSVKKKISKATGGTKGKMPHFFQFSKNGRKDTPSNNKKKKNGGYGRLNDSTMNRICEKFNQIGIIDFNKANVSDFNPLMLQNESDFSRETNQEIYKTFCELVRESSMIVSGIISTEESYSAKRKNDIVKEYITSHLIDSYGSIELCYHSVLHYLFVLNQRSWHKGAFWNIFGEIAERNLNQNLISAYRCPVCDMLVPAWAPHTCPQSATCTCCDCGIIFKKTKSRNYKSSRCPNCIIEYKRETTRKWRQKHRKGDEE